MFKTALSWDRLALFFHWWFVFSLVVESEIVRIGDFWLFSCGKRSKGDVVVVFRQVGGYFGGVWRQVVCV